MRELAELTMLLREGTKLPDDLKLATEEFREDMPANLASRRVACQREDHICTYSFVAAHLYFKTISELFSSSIVMHLWNNDSGEESALSTPSWF